MRKMRKTPFKPVLSFLLFLCLKILFIEMGVAQNTTFIPVNVGVALDLGSDLDGKIALSCINMAVSDFYANHGDYKTGMVLTRVALAIRDSKKDVVGAAAAGSLSAPPPSLLISWFHLLFSPIMDLSLSKSLKKSTF
ncbi:hypothetical protein DKX38_027647 [Salix brachista]|uniref:Receptor ligand binding region domain-containing protein n=1 Tax=Salix brachista TaxID=2182728 RepID=A0A5N5J3P8_9ROSI|nr:hypothetical protein DKX38_027647 [Salix brachista]